MVGWKLNATAVCDTTQEALCVSHATLTSQCLTVETTQATHHAPLLFKRLCISFQVFCTDTREEVKHGFVVHFNHGDLSGQPHSSSSTGIKATTPTVSGVRAMYGFM